MRKRTNSETRTSAFYSSSAKPKTCEVNNIQQIRANFDSKIKRQVSICQSLFKNKEPQRCFDHSIMFSLFCTACRKVICASCLYKNQQHKRHHVIPLEKASNMINDLIVISQEKVNQTCSYLNQLKYQNQQFMTKISYDHKCLQKLLEKSYDDLLDLIRLKKKMQLKQLSLIKDEIEKKVRTHSLFLGEIGLYIQSKKNQALSQYKKTQESLFPLNILLTLTSFKVDNLTPKFTDMEIDNKTIPLVFKDIRDKLEEVLSRKNDNLQTKNNSQLKVQRSKVFSPKVIAKEDSKIISNSSSKKII